MAVEISRPAAAFLFLAVAIMAAAAAGTPNIMQGKKPDMYMPRLQETSALVLPAQKLVKSPRPMVSNQNTLFRAWCMPMGISRRLKKAYRPAPMAPMLAMPLPRATRAPKTRGQTNSRMTDATIEMTAAAMATKRLPLKKAKKSGSWVFLKRL